MYDYKNKKKNIADLNGYMLNRTLKMFEYEGLPDTIPARELEEIIQTKGYAYVTEVDGELYALWGGLGGELNEYYKPTEIVIANPWLKFNETLNIADDGILIQNDDMRMGLMPLYDKYHTLLTENDITMILNSYNNRVQTMISAGDDATKESAEVYLQKVKDGDQGVIAEQRIFDGISVHNAHSNIASNTIALTEFHQYLKATLYNEVGLDANYNMKRERLTAGEVQQNDEGLYPLVTNMLYNRRKAINEINEKYGTEITVTFGSVWKNRNLDGELNHDLQLGHTDDMLSGQAQLEQEMLLQQLLGAGAFLEPTEEPQAEEVLQPAGGEQVDLEVEPAEEPEGIVLSEKALNTDLDDLPAEQRLEIYDLIFGIEDEDADIDLIAQRIADILEGAEEIEADIDGEEEPETTEESREESTEETGEGQEEEEEAELEEEVEAEEQLEEPEHEAEVAETEELQEEVIEEPETTEVIEEEEIAEIIAEAVEEVIEVIEEEEVEEEPEEEEEDN